MWYAVQVTTGAEEVTVNMCKKLIRKELLDSCFVPKYEQKKRYKGKWHNITKVLFPGYIFIVTDNVVNLFKELERIPKLTKILGYEDEDFIALKESDVRFMKRFQNDKHIVKLSVGNIIGDDIVINEGPLKGFEGKIKRIDRHKRIAVVEAQLFGGISDITLGLEIIRKIK